MSGSKGCTMYVSGVGGKRSNGAGSGGMGWGNAGGLRDDRLYSEWVVVGGRRARIIDMVQEVRRS